MVQVVEAYPDTGRRVFQTVLTEFEKFLEHYFKNENEATRKGVSLAQQVEQRETLAIQYTIELRTHAQRGAGAGRRARSSCSRCGPTCWPPPRCATARRASETKAMKRAAADLIWSASAKVTREERAEVHPPPAAAAEDAARRHGLGRHERRASRTSTSRR